MTVIPRGNHDMTIPGIFNHVLGFCVALAASFVVFTAVSYLHGFFGDALQKKPVQVLQHVVAMTIPKKHEEEIKPQQHIRIVKANAGRTGNTGGSQLSPTWVLNLVPTTGTVWRLRLKSWGLKYSMRGRPMRPPCPYIPRRFPFQIRREK